MTLLDLGPPLASLGPLFVSGTTFVRFFSTCELTSNVRLLV
jgi:hypothetical protein